MSVNVYQPHLLVIPEDEANRDIVNGFSCCVKINHRQFWVKPPAGGWIKGRDQLYELAKGYMRRYDQSYAVLIVDFDNEKDRGSQIRDELPEEVRDRVFVIGALTDPESLKRATGLRFEELGGKIAEGCIELNDVFWRQQELLSHNLQEVCRLSGSVRELFFTRADNK